MRNNLKKVLFTIAGVIYVLSSFSQNAKVIFKPHPEFQRYPAELIKETKYNMIELERIIPGDSLVFSLEITDPEGEYYKLYDWAALTLFVKPGCVIVVDYNNRNRSATKFEGDLAKENAYLNQSFFTSFSMLYPGRFTETFSYEDFRQQVFARADSLKRAVKDMSVLKTFVKDTRARIDFITISTLLYYYEVMLSVKERQLPPEDFNVWRQNFKTEYSKTFLKDARKIFNRNGGENALKYGQFCQALTGIVYKIEPGFARQAGYALFEEQYALSQILGDVTRLYSMELLQFSEKVKDTVVSRVVNTQIEDKRNLLTGVEAMDFEFKDTEGNVHRLSNYKGKPMYIDVWATWCNPCKALAPAFQEFAVEYKGKNIKFISISIDKRSVPWLNYLKEHSHAENILELHSGNKKFQEMYKINGIPRFILIDKDFKIRMAFAYKPGMDKLKALLDQISRE